MTKKILSLAVAATIITGFTGCEGTTDETAEGTNGTGTSGQYDLRAYMAPVNSDTQTFKDYTAYGSREISDASYDGESTDKYTMDGNNFTLVADYGSYDSETTSFSVSSSKITSTSTDEDDMELVMEFPRSVDLNENFTLINKSFSNSYGDFTINGKCQITEKYSSKTFTISSETQTFSDVLKMDCTFETEVEGTGNYAEYSASSYDTSTSYLAKNIGEVFFEDKDCLDADDEIQDNASSCPGGEEVEWSILTDGSALTAVNEAASNSSNDSTDNTDSNSNDSTDSIPNITSYNAIFTYKNISNDVKQANISAHENYSGFTYSSSTVDCSSLSGYTLLTTSTTSGVISNTYSTSDHVNYCTEFDYSNASFGSGSTSYTLVYNH